MTGNYLIAIVLVLVLLIGWSAVQQLARWYALRHPEFGAFREEGGGCGKSCGCRDNGCGVDDNSCEHKHCQNQNKEPIL